MAKINEGARKQYMELIAPYRKGIALIKSNEGRLDTILKGNTQPYKLITSSESSLAVTSYHLLINSLSVSLLGVRNENALTDAKKACSLAIIQLEKVFTDLIDVPFSEYETSLIAVSNYPEIKRYDLIRKTGLALSLITEAFGDNTKWKWALVDLKARLTTLAKNCVDLKTLINGLDPRSDGFRQRTEFFNLVLKLLHNTADNYRLKYEVSTKRIDDMRKAVNYLAVLHRILMVSGQPSKAAGIKKKCEIWKKKMESDYKSAGLNS